ncbi:hypothetical protein M422DRAFT_225193 [Sphaerobolus stellatus SS14]|nr:hypothetical protein M422DRAFT_225193 [Sphaerobolus stellatus SS14]
MDDEFDTLAARVEEVSNRAFAFVPLPWRVLFLIGAALLSWTSNLHLLHLLGIDTAFALDMHSSSHLPYSHAAGSSGSTHLYVALYKLFATYASWCFGCWMLFRAFCGGNVEIMDQYKTIPQLCGLVAFIVLICPYNIVRKRERDLFLHGLYRCFFSPFKHPIYFSDVIMADIFTSLAKVFGDFWISACMLAPGGSLRSFPVQTGWMRLVPSFMMSAPYLIRFRQCLVEFLSAPYLSDKRALFNAIKYATAFPVIFLSTAQSQVIEELAASKGADVTRTPWYGEQNLFKLWLLAVAINSGYSFWWDVTNDWGLSLLKPNWARTQPHPSALLMPQTPTSPVWSADLDESLPPAPALSRPHPTKPQQSRGLRRVLLFNDHMVYYVAIALDLVLRLTWSLRLSSHLYTLADIEGGVFLLEALEIIRRWVWVFFRVEWEVAKRTRHTSMVVVHGEEELELVDQ